MKGMEATEVSVIQLASQTVPLTVELSTIQRKRDNPLVNRYSISVQDLGISYRSR